MVRFDSMSAMLRRAIAFGVFGFVLPAGATQTPIAPAPEVQSLAAAELSGPSRVRLSWTDGSSPFIVVRCTSPNFESCPSLTYLNRSLLASPIDDAAAMADSNTYFYSVGDALASPRLFQIAPAVFKEGDTVTVDGWGFSSNPSDIHFRLENGMEIPVSSPTTSGFSMLIPARSVSGTAAIFSPNGSSEVVDYLSAIGTGYAKILSLGLDSGHHLFIGDDNGTGDKVHRIDYTTGVQTTCVTTANPVGLDLNETGLMLVATHNFNVNNSGIVRTFDPNNCGAGAPNRGTSGTASSDPVDTRDIAYDRSGNNNGFAFVLDYYGDRIRRHQLDGSATTWLPTLGLGQNNPTASEPGGLTFNTAGEFFFTGQSTVAHYSAAKSLIYTWNSTNGIGLPGQIDVDDQGHLWIPNKSQGTVMRARTNPATRLLRTKIGALTEPKAVKLDRDPGDNRLYAYVAAKDAGGLEQVYRFLVGDTVRVHFKVLPNALIDDFGYPTSQAEMRSLIEKQVRHAGFLLKSCGLEVALEGIQFLSTDVGTGSIISINPAAGELTPNEREILETARFAEPGVVNVYVVRAVFDTNGDLYPAAGITYTNDLSRISGSPIDNTTHSGIVMVRQSPDTIGGPFVAHPSRVTLPHELAHVLLTLGANEHSLLTDHIMYETDLGTGRIFESSECTAMTTNGDESPLFILGL